MTEFGTAGFVAPLAIVLRVGLEEAVGTLAIAVVGLLSAAAMHGRLRTAPLGGAMALLMVLMGLSGIVLTRDLFNMFVFLEISSIATYGLVGYDDRRGALKSGFKYMMAGGIASALYLIGVIYIYRFGDHLNLDLAAQATGLFPANGWAIGVYETADTGVSAILSGASATALVLAVWKIMPILGEVHLSLIAGTGLVTFVAGNLTGARQKDSRRMLGYSSTAQVGLVLAVMALDGLYGFGGPRFVFRVAGVLLLNHALAKTGLFLLSGAIEDASGRKDGAAGVLVLALVGLPPFPGFWAKWSLMGALVDGGQWWLVGLVLAGSLVEAFYVLRWYIVLAKGESGVQAEAAKGALSVKLGLRAAGPVLLAAALAASGVWLGFASGIAEPLLWAPLAAAAALFIVDRAPGWLKAALSMTAAAGFGWLAYERLDGLRLIFALMLLGGGVMYSFAAMYRPGSRRGLHPLLSATTLALGAILVAQSPLEFFFAWETMTVASWLLVLRGRNGANAALAYIVFGLGGAFLLMTGLLAGTGSAWPMYLMVAGLLVKLGAIGVHVWLPGAYAEADDEVSGFLSSSLSKAGIFALLATLAAYSAVPGVEPFAWRVLGWIGLATALFGALYAIYQEDIKKTLAWSSMGQIGYIVLALAIGDHAGWTAALYLALNHFIYKSMLFLAIAGVVHRVGTRNMYEMGGLIKKMPVSFLSVLMAIIAMSGVPPLTGFGGKWLLYSSLMGKGWYLEAAVAFFASAVAFLYLFRLIHTIFLGQPKPSQAGVKEAPMALLIPQGILMVVLFAFSAFPRLMLDPIIAVTGRFFPPLLGFSGSSLESTLGYWDGTLTMVVTIAVFMLCLGWMLLNLHNTQPVKQFNIVFAAERPYRPETTHFAWNFYAPYEKALGFLTKKRAERFWAAFGTGVDALGGAARRFYTGNGQTYALHVVLYVATLYLIMGAL